MTGKAGQRRAARATIAMVIAGLFVMGCAAHRVKTADGATSNDWLSEYMSKVRVLQSEARPAPATPPAMTVEASDPSLATALGGVNATPTAAAHIEAAVELRRLGILDQAYSHLSEAIALDARNATAYDLRARIWRDWGFPTLGYGDAYQAVKLAPRSAAAANTLGTLFQAADNPLAARIWYEKALSLEPAAAYAVNNLCYVAVLRGDNRAVATCEQAVAAAPDSRVAHNNLGLAYAAADDYSRACLQYASAGNGAEALYNMGITYLARRQYGKAIESFTSALRLKPQLPQAAERLRQASVLDAQ
jgi:tetratricopeptide (TPR) repeat protein